MALCITAVWIVDLCDQVEIYRRFEGIGYVLFFKEHLRSCNIRAHSCPAGEGISMSLRTRSQVRYRIHNSLTFVIVHEHKDGLHIPTGGTTLETT